MTPCPIAAPKSANSTNLRLYLLPKLSLSGLVAVFPSDFAFLNSGDSSIFFSVGLRTIYHRYRQNKRYPPSPAVNLLLRRDRTLWKNNYSEMKRPNVAVVWIQDGQ